MGAGPFQTYASHTWVVRSGWVISGDGMYSTTIQMVGSVSGLSLDVDVFKSDPNVSTDNVVIQNLAIDCNWNNLTNKPVGPGGEYAVSSGGVILFGTNNLVQSVRCSNAYGSFETAVGNCESLVIALYPSKFADAVGNTISNCLVDSPQGTHMAPFGIGGLSDFSGATITYNTGAKVLGCTAIGVNNGLGSTPTNPVVGFNNSGGVNFGYVKNLTIDSNTFIDCYGAAYCDTGSTDGLQVTNNTVIRGWAAIGLGSPTPPKQNILISGNSFSIQNRSSGANAGINWTGAPITNFTVTHNTLSADTSGSGSLQFWGVIAYSVTNATITNNVVDPLFYNKVTGTGLTISNNTQPNGAPVDGL